VATSVRDPTDASPPGFAPWSASVGFLASSAWCSVRFRVWLFLFATGCFGLHVGHAPGTPYPITLADLGEPAVEQFDGRLAPEFGIPTLRSLAPDPISLTMTSRRQVEDVQVVRGITPPPLIDAFHARVGGHASGALPVDVVIERMFSGCYQVKTQGIEPGHHQFVEAWIDFGDAGGRRIRFSRHDATCFTRVDEQLAQLGDDLARATILVSRDVQ
jgi:hypothetical protein